MKSIIVKELKLIRKDKRSFVFLLLMPAIFILMFNMIYSNSDSSSSVSIHAVDQDQSPASADFLKQVGAIMDVKLDDASKLNDQVEKIKKGQYTAMLVIPQGFGESIGQGKPSKVQLIQDPTAGMELMPIQAILDGVFKQYREQKLASLLASKGESQDQVAQDLKTPIEIQNVSTASDHFNALDQVVPGMTVMFVFYIMITMTRRFFDEKKTGLLARISSTRIKPLEYLIGMWIPFVLTIIAQCTILFAFGHLFLHMELGDIKALAVIVLGLSLAGSGIGLGLAFVVPGESAAMVLTQVISMGGAMVGGLWTPSYMLPDAIQTAGHFTPQYWAQHALQNVVAHGAHAGDVLGAAAILTAFGLAGLAVALFRLPAFLRSAVN